jgi:hypothetical protein
MAWILTINLEFQQAGGLLLSPIHFPAKHLGNRKLA